MTQTIDVTGLTPDAIRAVESLVRIIRTQTTSPAPDPPSIFDVFGKAPTLRSGSDIAAQVQEERNAWDER